jgi:membrane-associated phospholipid phosphatase
MAASGKGVPLGTASRFLGIAVLALDLAFATHAVAAESVDSDLSPASLTPHAIIADAGAYLISPLHWDRTDWSLFAGSIAAVAVAHHYDSSVRDHFTRGSNSALSSKNAGDLQDAVPAAALLAGTWLYGAFVNDSNARTAAWAMTEAAGLSTVSTMLVKTVAGRERPNQTTDSNRWRAGGSSFPSLHVSLAFAIGASFAESGAEGSRWLTRTVGYGIAGFTAYQRLQHNAHWLSDAVAGAALGTATGWFVVGRTYRSGALSGLSLSPSDGGMMVSYRAVLPVD